jgi:hypothetical protein
MNIPADIAAEARPTAQILSFWSFPIAWRRSHQGVLIRAGRTGIITVATGIRLLSLAGGLFGGLLLLPEGGAVVAGLAMILSVTVEALLITWATRPVLDQAHYGPQSSRQKEPDLTLRDLWSFYWPLVVTTFFRQLSRPLLNAGIALAALARESLAAWPVAWGVAILITGPAWSLQQLTTALAANEAAYQQVRRFALSLSVLFSLILAGITFTPLYSLVMGGVYNLSPELQDLAQPATQLMSLLPLLMGSQALLRGRLIRGGCTGTVRSAMMLNVALQAVSLVLGVTVFAPTGVLLAAVATIVGGLAELFWLGRKTYGLA